MSRLECLNLASRSTQPYKILDADNSIYALGAASRSSLNGLERIYSIEIKCQLHLARPYCAAQPPSIFQATPRTWLAAGLQKNTASAPNCSVVTNSPDGCFSISIAFF